MKILLINPRYPESLWSFRWISEEVRPTQRAINPPLGLATLAALCPEDWDVEIVDENVEIAPLETDADIVGIGGMSVQHDRQMELVRHFQAQGKMVVVGGAYASLCPEAFEGQVDVVISGEAEYIWPQFCEDYARGEHKALYKEDGTVDLADSPTPRFDLLKLQYYRMASLQFSRGCPFRCEFCDIIVMFGRKPRTKSPEQIGLELDALRASGITDVFFVDDNFIGHKPKAKGLLAALVSYQEHHGFPFRFGTEASTDLARHKDLMEPMRDSGFEWVFLGIETPDPKSLAETKKFQNTQSDLLESVHKIYSYGIDILAGFIVGFDNDTTASFEMQREFLQKSGIQMANVSMLNAMPKTPLYERLEEEGRLREDGGEGRIDIKLSTNIVPKGMSYDELVEGYRKLYLDLYTDEAIAERIVAKAGSLRRTRRARDEAWAGPAARIASKGIAAGGIRRVRAAAKATRDAAKVSSASEAATQSLIDWGFALSVRSYLDRHFQVAGPEADAARGDMERALRSNGIHVSADPGQARVVVDVRSDAGLKTLARKVGTVLDFLSTSPEDLVLDLRGVSADRRKLAKVLESLRPFGSRIRVHADRTVLLDERMELWRFDHALPLGSAVRPAVTVAAK